MRPAPRQRAAMQGAVAAAVVLGLLAVQYAGFSHIPLFGVHPEILLVFACGIALRRGPSQGFLIGALLGFLHDVPGGHLIGLSVPAYGLAGLLAGSISRRVFPDRWLVVLSAVALGTAASQLVYIAGAYAFGFLLPSPATVLRILAPLLLYHLLLTPFVYALAYWVNDSLLPETLEA